MWVTVSDERDDEGNADAVVDDTIVVTINVIDVDEPGRASFSTDSPREGQSITPWITDPDDNVHNIRVRWERLETADATGGTLVADSEDRPSVPGVVNGSYTPVSADVGKWLRVTFTYDDVHGTGKRVTAVTAAVAAR